MLFGSLFTGIGGIDLGLERAGMTCAWQVEKDPFAIRVLEKHWPQVPRFLDVKEVGSRELGRVDLIAGGFPCQDISTAGRQAGLSAERSGLWFEFRRIVAALLPDWAIVENVFRGWRQWVPAVRRELFGLGYASLPIRLRAFDVGAPHERGRVFVICSRSIDLRPMADAIGERLRSWWPGKTVRARQPKVEPARCGAVADADGEGQLQQGRPLGALRGRLGDGGDALALSDADGLGRDGRLLPAGQGAFEQAGLEDLERGDTWAVEPDVGRVAYGVPNRAHRLRGLGNAVVPQKAEWIGRWIMRVADKSIETKEK